jgi:hypothetical protein
VLDPEVRYVMACVFLPEQVQTVARYNSKLESTMAILVNNGYESHPHSQQKFGTPEQLQQCKLSITAIQVEMRSQSIREEA